MRNRIILAIGLTISLLGRTNGQEATSLPTSSAQNWSEGANAAEMPAENFSFAEPNNDRWVSADFLFGWFEGAHLPALVTTSNPVPATKDDAGVLGKTGTRTLLSGTKSHSLSPGFRLGAGYIFDHENGAGIEAGFIYLPRQSSSDFFSSTDHSVLARPFFDPVANVQASEVVSFPGSTTSGNITVDTKNANFYSVNLDLTERILGQEGQGVDVLFGYRYADFGDRLTIRQHSVLGPNLAGISTIDRLDDFNSRNVFHGLDLGLRGTYSGDQWSLSLLGKVAPGSMSQMVDIRGQSVTKFTSGNTSKIPAGVYALSSNSGSNQTDEWTVIPEFGANFNWKLRQNLALRMGYSALFLINVAKADDQIDFNINKALVGAPAGATPKQPKFPSTQSDLWIQTVNLGVEWTF
ncbi:MAG: Lpg1974 family pore-forming outer membrane protein [Planctomycetia bacterium]|nr:Lpg1974 family pore-forming outer membrane protein [Planctomycetia bacterium]